MAGPCEPGDVLGVIEGDFAVVGAELYDVAVEVIDRLVGGGGDLGDAGERGRGARPGRAVR